MGRIINIIYSNLLYSSNYKLFIKIKKKFFKIKLTYILKVILK